MDESPVVHWPGRDSSLAYQREDFGFDSWGDFLTCGEVLRRPVADEPKRPTGRLKETLCNFSGQFRVVI
jgi:hypothetical protein